MNEPVVSRWARTQPWVSTLLRLVLAGVCLWAGLAKVGDLPASVRAVRAFELLPEALAKPVGYGLPVLEIALGVLLLVGLLTRYAAAVVALLMVAFIIGISAAWARGLAIDCGCFGGGGPTEPDQTQYPLEIFRDLAIAAGAVFLVRWPTSRFSLDQTLGLVVPDEA
ncbi:DoxX family membrane protein [Actinotalea sp. M2MS4P-6]|uniref:MauE/DoxX family redox-associated membrane protein n=1 Tax=Actinotalea sp. M2MS4P-6 TaxID=2983762 RepID=UPI0021E3E2A7|nr:MauE/DoxX family redox-associated membrane protein [Actinotalea sp. M2MS4P-6]MCV2395063.1 DoxX family membrane protein [Actinotalea sp. M2MS4P-6]